MPHKAIYLSQMQNDEHFQFQMEFGALIEATGVEKLKIEPWYATWKSALTREDTALKKIAGSALTEEIHAIDATRDTLFRGMATSCKTATDHYDDDVSKAARKLQIVFNSYGNITRKGLMQKSSAIFNLLTELGDHHVADLTKTGLDGWATRLKAANDECERLLAARWDESAQRTDVVMKDARTEVDAAYNDIVSRIEARQLLDEDELFGEFLRRLGVMIDTYNAVVARRKGGKETGIN